MKFSLGIAVATLAWIVSAAPQLTKRASTSEIAPSGYATLNGGTTGGVGGPVIPNVSTLADLQSAVAGNAKKIVIVSGTITGNTVINVGSNTSILGANSAAALVGIGLRIYKNNNIIIRNLAIQKVQADAGDAILIQASKNVWIDHVNLSSDMDHDKDYYDGLIDITHGTDFVTISHSYLHDHFKASLIGHSDANADEDSGHLTVTYKHNHFKNINSRTPTLRFGTSHIYNNLFTSVSTAITVHSGGQLLLQNNVFESTLNPLTSTPDARVTHSGNAFGSITVNPLQAVPPVTVPYPYSLGSTSTTKSYVLANVGNVLTFA